MGQDDLHVTVNDQSRSRYGGVLALTVASQEGLIQLTPEAAAELQVTEELRIALPDDATDYAQLHGSLVKLCDSYGQYGRS